MLKVYFDGGCRPARGLETAVVTRGIATVLRNEDAAGDSADAEWLALIRAAETAVAAGAEDVVFVGDSAVVVAQAMGRQPCRRASLAAHRAAFLALAAAIPRWRVRHVRRGKNLAGIALAGRIRAVCDLSKPFVLSEACPERPAVPAAQDRLRSGRTGVVHIGWKPL